MMDSTPAAARWLITAGTLAYGLGPFVIDMNRTHLRHPAWPGHARFHLLWAAVSQLLVAGVALWLVWSDAPDALWRCRLAAVLGLCSVAGFWGALLFMKSYGGTLHDAGGIPPIAGKVDATCSPSCSLAACSAPACG